MIINLINFNMLKKKNKTQDNINKTIKIIEIIKIINNNIFFDKKKLINLKIFLKKIGFNNHN